MQREEMELLAVRATLGRMEIEILRRYRFAKRGRRFGSDVELMIVYGAAIAHYGFGTPVRALPISCYLEMPRETVRLRSSGRYDCFARELRDYCDYRRLFQRSLAGYAGRGLI